TATLAVRSSYLGSVSHYQMRPRLVNVIPPGTIAPAANPADEIARIPQFTSVFSASNALTNGNSNRLDPRFNAIFLNESSGNSNYNGLAMEVNKRFSRGHEFHVSYTWSKSIDDASDALSALNDDPLMQNPFNMREGRSVSQFDIPHRLVINHVWQPAWAPGIKGPVGTLLHGWGFSGIFQTQSGFPATIFAGTRYGINDAALAGNSANKIRANVVGDLSKLVFVPLGSPQAALIPTPDQRGINTTANQRNTNVANYPLEQPMLGHFGNLGRNTIRLNSLTNFDWIFFKDTRVHERVNV